MRVGSTKERTAIASPEPSFDTPKNGPRPWALVAVAIVAMALAIGALVTVSGRAPTQSRPVYLDPMTGAREGGTYAQPEVGAYADPMTGAREGGTYAQPEVGAYADPMTGAREGGTYSTSSP